MNKLVSSSPLMEIVNTINKLVDEANNSKDVITSFSNDVVINDPIIIDTAKLKQGYTLTMTSTGIHSLILEGTGTVQIIINEANTLNNFKYEISDKDRVINLVLASNDKIFFKSEDVVGLVKIRQEMTILQSFIFYTKKLQEVSSSLESIETLSFNLQNEIRQLQELKAEFNQQMTIISNTQRDLQNLSQRVSRLESI